MVCPSPLKREKDMKGYPTQIGYMGYIPNKGYTLFATENDYCEYYDTHKEEWEV